MDRERLRPLTKCVFQPDLSLSIAYLCHICECGQLFQMDSFELIYTHWYSVISYEYCSFREV